MLSAFYHLIIIKASLVIYCYYPHFRDDEMEKQLNKVA